MDKWHPEKKKKKGNMSHGPYFWKHVVAVSGKILYRYHQRGRVKCASLGRENMQVWEYSDQTQLQSF